MPRGFDIQFTLVRSGWLWVEAETEEEAKQLAEQLWSYPDIRKCDFDLDEDDFEITEIDERG